MEFSTLNESSLHKSLKIFYAELYEGKTEIKQDQYIYDIITKNGNIIEIQTKNLGKLKEKIEDTINKGHNVKLVHPLVIRKRINTLDKDGKIIKSRLSPTKGSIYDIFKELTGLHTLLLNSHFSLEILEVNIIEERKVTEELTQSKNKRRRFKKNWIKENKKLEEILNTRIFNKKEDYFSLLPTNLPKIFCAKDLYNTLKENKTLPKQASKQAHLIIWVLRNMNLLQEEKIEKRNHYYSIKK